jgi:hypothetical protein
MGSLAGVRCSRHLEQWSESNFLKSFAIRDRREFEGYFGRVGWPSCGVNRACYALGIKSKNVRLGGPNPERLRARSTQDA